MEAQRRGSQFTGEGHRKALWKPDDKQEPPRWLQVEKWSGREVVPNPTGDCQCSGEMLEGVQRALACVVVCPPRHPSWSPDAAVRPTALPHLDPSGDTSFTSQSFPGDPHIYLFRERPGSCIQPSQQVPQSTCIWGEDEGLTRGTESGAH